MAVKTKNKDASLKHCIHGWFGTYTSDYAYMSEANGILFILMFDRTKEELTSEQKEAFKENLKISTGLEFDDWIMFAGAIPKFSKETLRLFYKDKILAGTISGMMDPGALFGIHGALLSGKIAAMAVTDRESALKDFQEYNKFYLRSLYGRLIAEKMPLLPGLMHFALSNPKIIAPAVQYVDRGIPGYNRSIFKDWTGLSQ